MFGNCKWWSECLFGGTAHRPPYSYIGGFKILSGGVICYFHVLSKYLQFPNALRTMSDFIYGTQNCRFVLILHVSICDNESTQLEGVVSWPE